MRGKEADTEDGRTGGPEDRRMEGWKACRIEERTDR